MEIKSNKNLIYKQNRKSNRYDHYIKMWYIKMQKINLQINLNINYNYQRLITFEIYNKNNMMKYHPILRNNK